MRSLSRFAVPGLLALAVVAGGAASAQAPPSITCPSTVATHEELRTLPELKATGGVLTTTYSVEFRNSCVPVSHDNGSTWSYEPQTLSTYVYTDPKTNEPSWG